MVHFCDDLVDVKSRTHVVVDTRGIERYSRSFSLRLTDEKLTEIEIQAQRHKRTKAWQDGLKFLPTVD